MARARISDGWRGERRGRLLDAAARVFSRVSYQQAVMDEIAAEAGVGKPTLYRYFDSKDALFTAVFEDALDRLEARLDAVLRRESDPEARLRGLVLELIPTFRDHLVGPRVLGGATAMADQSKRRIFRERRSRIAALLARALASGDDALHPERVGHLVIGMIWSGTASIQAPDGEIADAITRLVLHGATGAPAEGAGGPDHGETERVSRTGARFSEARVR